MDENNASGIKPIGDFNPLLPMISRKERWCNTATTLAQLVDLYLIDPDLIFTDRDFSFIETLGQIGHSDVKAIISQFRLSSSLEQIAVYKAELELFFVLYFDCTLHNGPSLF